MRAGRPWSPGCASRHARLLLVLQHSLPNSTLDQAASAYKLRVTDAEGLRSEGPVPALMSGGQ